MESSQVPDSGDFVVAAGAGWGGQAARGEAKSSARKKAASAQLYRRHRIQASLEREYRIEEYRMQLEEYKIWWQRQVKFSS